MISLICLLSFNLQSHFESSLFHHKVTEDDSLPMFKNTLKTISEKWLVPIVEIENCFKGAITSLGPLFSSKTGSSDFFNSGSKYFYS